MSYAAPCPAFGCCYGSRLNMFCRVQTAVNKFIEVSVSDAVEMLLEVGEGEIALLSVSMLYRVAFR